jgi:hypothetical protein
LGNKFLHRAETAENVREKLEKGNENLWNISGIPTIERVISERNAVSKANCPSGLFQKLRFPNVFQDIVAEKEARIWRGIGGPNDSIYRNFVCEGPKLPFVQYPSVVSYEQPCTRDPQLDQISPG